MRRLALFLLLTASCFLSACADPLRSQQPRPKPAVGYWFWAGSIFDESTQSQALDVLYVHSGILSGYAGPGKPEPWAASGFLPPRLPPAREYWLAFRYEHQIPPLLEAAPIWAHEISAMRDAALKRGMNVVGVQLDIDSPTSRLPAYAEFLHELRKNLPKGFQISITALLDWFSTNTQIESIVKEVDEFVPQFYDVGHPAFSPTTAVAAKFDPAHWGPLFSRFQKRYRVGISTFGRAWILPGKTDRSQPYQQLYSHDLKPLDVGINPAFTLTASRNEANELQLNYRATRGTSIGYQNISSGDTIQFILANPESIRDAVESAAKMPGQFAGVVFFRWPSQNEVLAMPPGEVLFAAGLAPLPHRPSSIEFTDGDCVAVKCGDIYFRDTNPLSPNPIRYRIHGSAELQYFLPEKDAPIRMVGPSDLELVLPPYGGRGRLHLGRAVSLTEMEFMVTQP